MVIRTACRQTSGGLVIAMMGIAFVLGISPASAQTPAVADWCVSDVFAHVTCVEPSSDGTKIAISGLMAPNVGQAISIRSAVDGAELRSIPVPGIPRWIAWRPGTSEIACSYSTTDNPLTHAVQVYNADTGAEVVAMTTFTNYGSNFGAYSPDGSILATLEQTMWIRFFDADTGDQVNDVFGITMGSMPTCLAFSEDGTRMATGLAMGNTPNEIKIWSVPGGALLDELSMDETRVVSVDAVTYSKDGKYLAATNGDGLLKVWNTIDGTVALTLQASDITGSIRGHELAFAPDSDLLAWGVGPYPLATVFVRVSTGETVATYTEGALSGLSFMPDGLHWLRGSDYWGHGACLYPTP